MTTTPQQLADELIGTCAMSYPDERLATVEDIATFDALAFECNCCGWWFSVDDLNDKTDERLCQPCADTDIEECVK